MNKRPPTVTALAILYMVVGLVSTSYHLSQFRAFPTVAGILESFLMVVLGGVAVAAGYFMLQGKNWARWTAFSWTVFHVLISGFQSPGALIFHLAFVFLLSLLLFSKEAKEWFAPTPATAPTEPAPRKFVIPPVEDLPQAPVSQHTDTPPAAAPPPSNDPPPTI